MSVMATQPQLDVRVLTESHDLQQIAPEWRALLDDSDSNEPTLSPEWLRTWWEVFGGTQSRQLRFLRVDAQGELAGLVPLQARRHWYRPGLPFRRLELLASGEPEADAICSDYLNLIARRGHESAVAGALIEALATGKLGGWDELVIPLMDGNGVMPSLLVYAAQARGWHAECERTTRAPYIQLPDSWEGYLKQLDKKDRYLINRSFRDFDQWAAGEAVLHRADDAASLENGKRILLSLHQDRWENVAGGTFRSPLFLAFHDRLMPELLGQGALELLWLTVRGEPVAAMYNIRWNGKVYFYQCGRKMDVAKSIRPGGVLLYRAIQDAIASGMREFDFLGGEAVYKKQLATASRPLVQLRLARRSLVERGRRLAGCIKDRVRPLWHRMRGKWTRASPAGDRSCEEALDRA